MDAITAMPGGVFLGTIVGLIGFFFVELIREAKSNAKSMLVPASILLVYFGSAIWGAAKFAAANDWLLLWFIVSAAWVLRQIYKRDS